MKKLVISILAVVFVISSVAVAFAGNDNYSVGSSQETYKSEGQGTNTNSSNSNSDKSWWDNVKEKAKETIDKVNGNKKIRTPDAVTGARG